MDFGPILRRELIVSPRRGTISLRAGHAAITALVIAAALLGRLVRATATIANPGARLDNERTTLLNPLAHEAVGGGRR
jgi:hypothetical protein